MARPSMPEGDADEAATRIDPPRDKSTWAQPIAYSSRGDEAIAAHQEGLPTDPDPAGIVDDVATLLAEGRHEDALRLYEQTYELNPPDELRYKQAECLDALGLPFAAAACYEDWIASTPQAPEVEKFRARIAELRALAESTPVPATGRSAAREWMARGHELLRAGRHDDAVNAYREGYRSWPDEVFIFHEATTLLDCGRYAEADLACQRYLANPDAPHAAEVRVVMDGARSHMGGRAATITGFAEATRLFEEGYAAYQASRYEEALAAFERAHHLNPLADLRYNQATCLDKLGLRSAAAACYDAYLSEAPNAPDAGPVAMRLDKLRAEAEQLPIGATGRQGGREWMARGLALLQARRHDAAIAAFQQGFRTWPDPAFIFQQATALFESERYAAADLAYQRYLCDPNLPRADEARLAMERARARLSGSEAILTGEAEAQRLAEEGRAHDAAGRHGEALQAFDRAHALSPLPGLRIQQAACLERLGLRELAAQRYEAYLAEAPGADDAAAVRQQITALREQARTSAQSAYDRGQAAYAQGQWREAARAYAQAYDDLPLPDYLFNQGQALARAGDRTRAVHCFELYLDLKPGAPDADDVRARIEVLQQAPAGEDPPPEA